MFKQIRLTVVFTLGTILAAFATPAVAGLLPGYQYRQAITVGSSMTPADVTDFPVLIKVTDQGSPLFTHAKSPNGYDIAFTAEDGTTLLSHEVEHFSAGGTKELDAWVKTDLSSSADTTLYMYYGKSGVSTDPSTTATWNSNYNMVQHLQETSATRYDSTANGNDAGPLGNVVHDPSGQINGADEFDGVTGTRLVAPPSVATPITVVSRDHFTASVWFQPDSLSGYKYLFSHMEGLGDGTTAANDSFYMFLSNATLRARIWTNTPGSQWESWLNTTVPDAGWHHAAFVFDGPNNMQYLYLDGSLATSTPTTGTQRWESASYVDAYVMAARGENELYDRVLDGSLDEVRLLDTAVDADWIQAVYRNQFAPGQYLGFGAETLIPEPASIVLFGLGGLGLIGLGWRRKKK